MSLSTSLPHRSDNARHRWPSLAKMFVARIIASCRSRVEIIKCGFAKYLGWFHYSIFHICLLCYIWICKFGSHACFHHSCIMSYICGFVIVLMHDFMTKESKYAWMVHSCCNNGICIPICKVLNLMGYSKSKMVIHEWWVQSNEIMHENYYESTYNMINIFGFFSHEIMNAYTIITARVDHSWMVFALFDFKCFMVLSS
jgi:hypothetical protein